MKHTAFFGEREHAFALPFVQMQELERVTGCGFGALSSRLRRLDFNIADIAETIRLGLIGGGMSPADAAAMIPPYVTSRPLGETLPLAIDIIEAAWTGEVVTRNKVDD